MILRRMVIALVVLLAVCTAVNGAENDWTMARYDEAQTGYTPQKLTLPLTMFWQHNTTKTTNNTSTPAVLGDTVYFSSGNRVYALDATTGAAKWRFPAGAETLKFGIKTGITVWEDMVFFGGMDGKLYALNAANGLLVWAFSSGAAIRSTPVVSNGTIFVGSDDDNLYAIDARSGELSWISGFRTRDDVASSPAISQGMAVFTSLDGNVYAANVATGKLRWTYRIPAATLRSAPVISGNLVIVAAGRGIHVLSLKSGQLRYVINLPSDVATPLAVAGNDIYVICRNWKLYAYTAGLTDVKAKWTAAVDLKMSITAPPTVAGDVVYVGTNRGMIYGFSAETGDLLWNYTAAPSIIGNAGQAVSFTSISAPIVVANGALYALTDDGSLRCLRNDAPDNTPPKIFNVAPKLGVALSGHPPIQVSAILYDESTGIDPQSIQLLLDGDKVNHTFDVSTLKLYYETPITTPVRPLSDKRHELMILAKDWKGNELRHTWSFVVDNSLPPPKIVPKTKPAPTTKTNRPTPPAPPTPPSRPTMPGRPGGQDGPGGPSGPEPVAPGGPGYPGPGGPGQPGGPGGQQYPGWRGDGPPPPAGFGR